MADQDKPSNSLSDENRTFISESEFTANHKKYMKMSSNGHQVFIQNLDGRPILILGHGPLRPVPEDCPDPLAEMPSKDRPILRPGEGWLD